MANENKQPVKAAGSKAGGGKPRAKRQGEGAKKEQKQKAPSFSRAEDFFAPAQEGAGKQSKGGQAGRGQKAKGAASAAKKPSARGKKQQEGTPEPKSTPDKGALRIISLGGLHEIGKNITVIEYQDEIVVVDCGVAFPDDDMLGVDLVIPDVTYLLKNKQKVKGIVLTHGHEDHIGSLPYVLRDLNVPVYGTPMTMGLLRRKLEEHRLDKKAKLNIIHAGDVIKLGCFSVEAIHVNHSIVDALAFAIRTPVGTVIHSGDFKIDSTPIKGGPMDLARLGEIGNEGVLALLLESTNAERSGSTMSERTVGESFQALFSGCKKRIIVATFASNVDRVQQIMAAAEKNGRKVAVSGRSMLNMLDVAGELGYLEVKKGTLIDIDQVDRFPKEQVCIITTGSQGEPMSALYRMAYSDHRKVEIGAEDLVIISSSPIPGNDTSINKMINELYKRGAEIVHEALHEVHVSGHACQEELKMMMAMTKPKYLVPIHGEYRHLYHNRKLAMSMGIPEKNILISDIGKVIEIGKNGIQLNGTVPSGKIMVDGLGVGDVGNIVLRDRMHLSQDGLIVVVLSMEKKTGRILSGPDVVSRGFVYMREAEEMMEQVRVVTRETVEQCLAQKQTDWSFLKNKIKGAISDGIRQKTRRNPMILPVIMEV